MLKTGGWFAIIDFVHYCILRYNETKRLQYDLQKSFKVISNVILR